MHVESGLYAEARMILHESGPRIIMCANSHRRFPDNRNFPDVPVCQEKLNCQVFKKLDSMKTQKTKSDY